MARRRDVRGHGVDRRSGEMEAIVRRSVHALTRKEVECARKEKELIKDFRELHEGKERLKRKRDETELRLVQSQVRAQIRAQLELGQDVDDALGGMTPSWTRAFRSCQDDRLVFRFRRPRPVGHRSRAPCCTLPSAPRQLPRIVASSPGTRAALGRRAP
jgi:hypothetical protein